MIRPLPAPQGNRPAFQGKPGHQVRPPAGQKKARYRYRAFARWCRRPDSNRHGLRHYPLKIACLPIPPLRLKLVSFGLSGRFTGGFRGRLDRIRSIFCDRLRFGGGSIYN